MNKSTKEMKDPSYQKYMPCSLCKTEFEWNGKDKGKLIRVKGFGMVCEDCWSKVPRIHGSSLNVL